MKNIKSSPILIAVSLCIWLIFGKTQIARAALAIDVNTTSAETTGLISGNTMNSPSFTTASSNELILVFIQFSTQVGTANSTVSNLTGAGLTWQLVKRTNTPFFGTAEIWRSFAASSLTNQNVTATFSTSDACGATFKCTAVISVVSFTGADRTGSFGSGAIGATGTNSSTSGTPSASLTTTRNNSWVMGTALNWTSSTAPTVPAGQTSFGVVAGAAGSAYWNQRQNSVTALSGTSVTINDTAPTAINYGLSLVEILPNLSQNVGIRGKVKIRSKVKMR